MQKLDKKYGFWTATAMVVGIVIGSGVFFKADDVLNAAGGSLPTGFLAWVIGGTIMVVTAYVFAMIAARIERVNGVVDYFEEAYGEQAGYLVAWFVNFMYYPTLVAVFAWVSANYSLFSSMFCHLYWQAGGRFQRPLLNLFRFFSWRLSAPLPA